MNIVKDTYAFVFSNLKEFSVIAAIPIVLLTALYTIQDLRNSSSSGFEGPRILIEILFAFYWHRFYLLGSKNSYSPFNFRNLPKSEQETHAHCFRIFMWGSIRLTIAMAIIGIIILVVVMSTSQTPIVIAIESLIVISLLIIACRILPIFPALSIGASYNISDIFTLTKGHTSNILAIFISISILPLVVAIILTLILEYTSIEFNLTMIFSTNFILSIMDIFFLALGVTANSKIFIMISNWKFEDRPEVEAT